MASRGAWTGLRERLVWTSWMKFSRTKGKVLHLSCSTQAQTQAGLGMDWEHPGEDSVCWWMRNSTWLIHVYFLPGKPATSWAASQEAWPADWGGWFCYSSLLSWYSTWDAACRAPLHKKDMDDSHPSPEKGCGNGWGLKCLSFGDRLRELGWFSLENRRLCRDLRETFQYIKGATKELERELLQGPCSDRRMGNGFKVKGRRFRQDVKNKSFTVRWWDAGKCCPEQLWMPYSWKCSMLCWIGLWVTSST